MKKFEIPTAELILLNKKANVLTTSVSVESDEVSTSGARMAGMYDFEEEEF